MLMRYSDVTRFRYGDFWCHVISGEMVNSLCAGTLWYGGGLECLLVTNGQVMSINYGNKYEWGVRLW